MDSTQSPPAPVPPPPTGTPEPLPYAVPALARAIPRPRPVIDGIFTLMWMLACTGTALPALRGRSLVDELVRSITRVNRFDVENMLLTGFIAAAFLCWAVCMFKMLNTLRAAMRPASTPVACRVVGWTLAGVGTLPMLALAFLLANNGARHDTILIFVVLGIFTVAVLAICRLRKRVDPERLAILALAVPAIAPVLLVLLAAPITGHGEFGLVFLALGPAAWCAEVILADQGSFRL